MVPLATVEPHRRACPVRVVRWIIPVTGRSYATVLPVVKGPPRSLTRPTHVSAWRPGATPTVSMQIVPLPYLDQLVTAAPSPVLWSPRMLGSYHGWLGNPALSEFESAYEGAPGVLK